MFPSDLSERLDSLIDELILDGGVEAASLASILLAAKDSAKSDDLLTLSCQVWNAANDLKATRDRNGNRARTEEPPFRSDSPLQPPSSQDDQAPASFPR